MKTLTMDEKYDLADALLLAVRTYEKDCDDARKEESQRIFGHRGASIASCFPTTTGCIVAMVAAMTDFEKAQAVVADEPVTDPAAPVYLTMEEGAFV